MLIAATSILLYSGAAAISSTPDEPQQTGFVHDGFSAIVGRGRKRLVSSLDDPKLSAESRRLLAALLMGERNRVPFELREAYSYLGIAHFLALSGLHLGIIFIPASFLVSFAPIRNSVRYLSIFCFVIAYAAVVGFPPSLVRASALTGAFLLMRGAGRKTTLMRSLVTGCMIAAFLESRIVFETGFQLSFTAVCAIALVAIPSILCIKELLPGKLLGRLTAILVGPLLVTASINVFTLPLVLSLFDRAPLFAPLVNLLVIVPVTAMLYCGVVFLMVPIDFIRSMLAVPIDMAAYALWNLPTELSRSVQPALIAGDVNSRIYCVAMIALVLGLRAKGSRRLCLLAITLIMAASSLIAGHFHGERSDAVTRIFRISNSLIFFSGGADLLVVDGDLRYFEAYRAVRYLWASDIDEIEMLIICPASMKNMRGLEHLVSRISVRKVLCNPYLLKGSIAEELNSRSEEVGTLIDSRSIELEGARIALIAPQYPPSRSKAVENSRASIRFEVIRSSIAR
jgi:competence protein ComEC